MQTNRADRPKAEQALIDCYKQADLPPPRVIVWHDNPIMTAFAGPIISYQLEGGRVRNLPENLFGVSPTIPLAASKPLTVKILQLANEALDQLKPTKRGIQSVNFRTNEHALNKAAHDRLRLHSYASQMARLDPAPVPSTEFAKQSVSGALIMTRVFKECAALLLNSGTFTDVGRKSPLPFAGPAMVREAQMLQGTPYARLVEACGWVVPYEDFAVLADNPKSFNDNFLLFHDGWYAR